ncbi:hypothetical protein [Cellulomonas edaphi]|uniref:SprT-like domain-containing protein n=1 Tax=Cellulomonas edaphi TaxID=3053468 RepID=A0ABT7S8I4_9CELL|nr:hypothetical protein [Cellulomons edaphi]MDM7831910.1 hypothetical protein [Cellulomons edaphi]
MTHRARTAVSTLVVAALACVGLVLAPAASAATAPFVSVITPQYALSTATVRFSGKVYPARGQKVTVQRKDGSRWVTIDTARVSTSTAKFSVAYRVKPGKKAFRLLVAKTSQSTWAKQSWTTWTTDGVKYKSYIARARSYMKSYCPRTPIFVSTPLVNSRTVGMATEKYTWTSSSSSGPRTYTWQHQIHIEGGLSRPLLRHVALHECAHVVQFRRLVKGPTARAAAEKTTAKVFKRRSGEYGDGNERQADCMAIVITHKKQYGGYTQSCTGARATSAKALWRAYGKKYQSSVYTFTRR